MSFAVYKSADDTVTIVVGLGLIGSAVNKVLSIEGRQVALAMPGTIDWDNSESILQQITPYILSTESRVEVIWCAGKNGFSATDKQLEREFVIFAETMQRLSQCSNRISISLMSSAGGIYEGAGGVGSVFDDVTPIRPYGVWKLKQEEYLQSLNLIAKVYRISSAYGINTLNSRRSIMSALFDSAYFNRSATVYAKASTLRDYVNSIDIAKHIVAKTLYNNDLVDILASGRPTSIDMLINMIRRATRKNPKVTYNCQTSNDADIVFSSSSIASDFKCRSIEEGVREFASHYKNFI